ncbi:MAG: cobalamin-binding protein [Candidatus Acidiferrales bacterium]
MRIASLLPSSTEILFALGLGDSVVGITHECDFPPEVRFKRVVVRSRLPRTSDPAEIDRLVRECTDRGESIYRVDAEALRELDPDLIVTQDLCHVCAASPDDLAGALAILQRKPKVLSLNPHTLADVWDNVFTIGAATGHEVQARDLVHECKTKVEDVARAVAKASATLTPPRVLCLEWLDPPFNAGHWVPEMVALAGGEDVLGIEGKPSRSISWEEIAAAEPEIILICPCGYDLAKARDELGRMKFPDAWKKLPAVLQGKVFFSDANAYFSRPGTRLAEGVAVLAAAINPHAVIPHVPPGSLVRCEQTSAASARPN